MGFKDFFSLSWWFALKPGAITSAFFQKGLIVFVLSFFILAIAFWVFKFLKDYPLALKRMFSRIIWFGLGMGIIGMILLFFVFQEIPFLSARFWWLLWILFGILWLVFLIRASFKIPGMLSEERRRKEEFDKYLPR